MEDKKVNIELLRGTEKVQYEITREKIKVNQVEGKVLSNNIGYIQFTSFDETTAEDIVSEPLTPAEEAANMSLAERVTQCEECILELSSVVYA